MSRVADGAYLSAARKISRPPWAVRCRLATAQEIYTCRRRRCCRTSASKGCRSARAAAYWLRYTFPQDGEYDIAVDLLCRVHGECDGSAASRSARVEVAIDGERVKLFTLEPRQARRRRRRHERTCAQSACRSSAGPHDVTRRVPEAAIAREADARLERFARPIT